MPSSQPPPHHPKTKTEVFRELYFANVPVSKIMATMRIGPGTYYTLLEAAKLPPRPRGPRPKVTLPDPALPLEEAILPVVHAVTGEVLTGEKLEHYHLLMHQRKTLSVPGTCWGEHERGTNIELQRENRPSTPEEIAAGDDPWQPNPDGRAFLDEYGRIGGLSYYLGTYFPDTGETSETLRVIIRRYVADENIETPS